MTAVVVYGESDGTIHLSGRSRDDRVHMGETLRHAVSDIPMANAGGHARMGGGQLSVDHMRGSARRTASTKPSSKNSSRRCPASGEGFSREPLCDENVIPTRCRSRG